MGKYDAFSAEDLRSLLFEEKLSHKHMTEEDYTALLSAEAWLDEPEERVIDYCYEGLARFSKYANIDVRDFALEDLYPRVNTKPLRHLIIKRVSVIAAALILTVILAQVVCMAFGFDFFGYIINKNKGEVVEVITTDTFAFSNEDISIDYLEIDEMPEEISNKVPDYLFENYDFRFANHFRSGDQIKNTYAFTDAERNCIILTVSKFSEIDIEKDEGGQFDEYAENGIVFSVFTNMDRYKAFWIYDGYVYELATPYEQPQKLTDMLEYIYK
jgi:hypothetical protein